MPVCLTARSGKSLNSDMPRYYDISPTLGPMTPAWPTDPPVVFKPSKSVMKGAGSNVTGLSMSSHAGSHVDAPSHLYSDGMTVEKLPLDVLIGPASVVEFTADIIDRGVLASSWPAGKVERLLFKTSNSMLWSSPAFMPKFVGLTADAADYLVERGVKLVGIDYLSIEAEHGTGAPVHQTLLKNNIFIIESLDLSPVEPGGYELICLPLKLDGLDGAPARVVLRDLADTSF
ncbi:MAG: cyclase family protein [Actinomycetota bacterium]|nr:cyclase family protein [Actinomycetota bacterium]